MFYGPVYRRYGLLHQTPRLPGPLTVNQCGMSSLLFDTAWRNGKQSAMINKTINFIASALILWVFASAAGVPMQGCD